MEQMINEDFYKNLFRLLNSSKPDASAELKKISDDLVAMYKEKGITEYWPPIPGDSLHSGEGGTAGSADFVPVSARKFEKLMAPFRKDSLPVDRLSPHAAALRSNSPRHSIVSSEGTVSKGASLDNQHSQDDTGDNGFLNFSVDTGDESSSSTPRAGVVASGSSKSSNEGDEPGSNAQCGPVKRGSADRSRSDDVGDRLEEGEPPEKKPKIVVEPPSATAAQPAQEKKREAAGASSAREEFDALVCVVCKTFALTSAGNLMVECHECHNMYHQKCHQPNVPNSQINDPRLLWYCHQCEKKQRSRAELIVGSAKSAPNGGTNGRRHTSFAGEREEKKHSGDGQGSSVLKRSTTGETKEKQPTPSASKPSTADLYSKAATLLEKHKKKSIPAPTSKQGNSTNNTNPFAMALSSAASSAGLAKSTPTTTSGGLSKLAVQQHSSTSTAAKTNTVSASPSASSTGAKSLQTSTAQMQAAEKRLQMMKKKAAMKDSKIDEPSAMK